MMTTTFFPPITPYHGRAAAAQAGAALERKVQEREKTGPSARDRWTVPSHDKSVDVRAFPARLWRCLLEAIGLLLLAVFRAYHASQP
mmetsp:Transcript_2025/g.3238  ORF Transcript_2025/g.3238 Transcript_2025/m.3238 type:complete len:87 (+) Transcript_2025:113-373(+)